jgi:glycosyltransferase involved in cell wall biosynthesis
MNTADPLVTIITPSYNRAWIIQDCIDCIKNQSYKNIEHIVIDGASTDHTLDILKQEQKNYNLQ